MTRGEAAYTHCRHVRRLIFTLQRKVNKGNRNSFPERQEYNINRLIRDEGFLDEYILSRCKSTRG
jgi:hypothetical protein